MSVSGILNLDKEPGPSSFKIVSTIRKASGVRKVGHAGTLDPCAAGVLLVCLGQAVRVTEYLMDLPKVYHARILLGATTTTYDSEGELVSAAEYRRVSEGGLKEALSSFEGEIEQTPPPFSAVKVDGERAYRLARRGQAVALRPRRARVYRLELMRYEPPLVEIGVECGRGTYIRSLAHDLGQRLGCGAYLAALTRTRVGPFRIEDAVRMAELQGGLDEGKWQDYLLPIDYGLVHLPAVTLHIEDEKDLRHGQALRLDEERLQAVGEVRSGMLCRAYAEDGSLAGIIQYDGGPGLWRPRKVFGASE